MSTIGRYQILQNIGQGGMGTLYLARDPAIDRLIAIKLLRDGIDNSDIRERFTREARSAGRLRHINIVTIFDVGEHDGQPFIAMEYVQGETLADLIRRQAPLSLVRKVQVMDELCAGLHYAHRAGVVHRDIKPANVMMDEEGVLKILDFGIARLGASGMTQAGMVMGTLNYMAPEQMEGKPIDARVDMFSTGALFYELLSYRRAFPGELPGILHKIMSGNPEPLKTVCPDLDRGLIAIVERCLEKAPEQRYADLAAIRRELGMARQRLLGEGSGDVEMTIPMRRTPIESTPVSGTPAPKSPRRDSSREERLRIRAAQIQTHVDQAREALERADHDVALQACHQALMIDPENAVALELEDRARTAVERRQAQEYVKEARGELERGAFTAASLLVERALSLNSTSPDAVAVQRAVEQARRELVEARERAEKVESAMTKAREDLDAGSLEAALQAINEAFAIDADSTAVLALKDDIVAARLAKQRADEEARARAEAEARVLAVVGEARRQFAAGDHAAALNTLETFKPAHAVVTAALADLRVEAQEIERRRLEAERRRQQEERRRAEEEAKRREAEEQRRRAEDERRRAAEARAAAEAAERVRKEIALKLTDATARLAQQDFDGAFSLTRSVLAAHPKHPDALAVDNQIKQAFERHRQIAAGLATARTLYDRGRFQETIEALGRLALLDPKAAGLAELRRAAEAGLAEAEAAVARRRAQEEAERRREEERKRAEEEASKRQAEDQHRRADEQRRQADEQRRQAEEQAARGRAEEEASRRQAEEQRRAAEETRRQQAEDQRRAADEAKRQRAEAQRRAQEEATRLQAEAQRTRLAEASRKAEKARQRAGARAAEDAERARKQAEASTDATLAVEKTVLLTPKDAVVATESDKTILQSAESLAQQTQPAGTTPSRRMMAVAAIAVVLAGTALALWLSSDSKPTPPQVAQESTATQPASAPNSQPPVTVAPPTDGAKTSAPLVPSPTPSSTPVDASRSAAPPAKPTVESPARAQEPPVRGNAPSANPPAEAGAQPAVPASSAQAPNSRPTETQISTTPLPEARDVAPRPVTPEPVAPAPPPARSDSAPTPASSAPSLSPAPNDEAAIRETMQRYQSGYESLDPNAVKAVYPSIDARTLATVFREYVSLKQTIQIDRIQIAPDGQTATVTGSVTTAPVVRTGRASPQRRKATFTLRKSGSSWIIGNVRLS